MVNEKLIATNVNTSVRILLKLHIVSLRVITKCSYGWPTKPVPTFLDDVGLRLFICEVRVRIKIGIIFNTICVDCLIRHVLSAKGAHKIVSF